MTANSFQGMEGFPIKTKGFRNEIGCLRFLLWGWLFFPGLLYGQGQWKDTIRLEEVAIAGQKRDELAGLKRVELDSLQLRNHQHDDLSEALAYYAPISIKSYGPGGVATASFRGSAASQTRIIWNGIPLNSPMLGQTDLSNIPLFFFDEIVLSHSGPGPGNPTGSLGGSIHIGQRSEWQIGQQAKAMAQAGSFGSFGQKVQAGVGSEKMQSDTRLSFDRNRFEQKKPGMTPVPGKNGMERLGLMQEFNARISMNHFFHGALWIQQKTNRSAYNQGIREEQQDEQFLRSTAEWKAYWGKHHLAARIGLANQNMDYRIENAGELLLESHNYSSTPVIGIDYSGYFGKKLRWLSGLSLSQTRVRTNNYDRIESASERSFYLGINLRIGQGLLFAMNKSQLFRDTWKAWIPTLGMEWPLVDKGITAKINLSSNFRQPALNDLFWNDDGYSKGNPDLLAESGQSAEGGLRWEKKWEMTTLEFEGSLFVSNIYNWISWMPDTTGRWSPVNLPRVFRRGLELNGSLQRRFSNWRLRIMAGGTALRASNEQNRQNSTGKNYQLLYVPPYSINLSTQIVFRSFQIMTSFLQQGKRNITTDESAYLPSYSLLNLSMEKKWSIGRLDYSIGAGVENLFDRSYESTKGYPMPGRSFNISLSAGWKNPGRQGQ